MKLININKKLKVSFLVILLSYLNACKESEPDLAYVDVLDLPQIEVQENKKITNETKSFINTVTGNDVTILSSLKNTAFHFYNDLVFKNSKQGLLVGGAGMKVRLTDDGGISWIEHSFSRFSNAFHSVASTGNSYHIVGESDYLFKTDDLGKKWQVLDAKLLLPKEQRSNYQFKLFKVRFYNNKLGLITGSVSNKPGLLKTIDGGENWQYLQAKGFSENEGSIGDFTFLSEKEIILVTLSGNCYKSIDGGQVWKPLFLAKSNDKNTIRFNSIAFKDAQTGFIGGLEGLMHTTDGGANWNRVDLPGKFNITDIDFIQGGVLISTGKAFNKEERNPFVLFVSEDGQQVKPFLIEEDETVFSQGDAYSIHLLGEDAYILDRNNLYKTSIQSFK